MNSHCILLTSPLYSIDFPGGSDGKKSACNAGDPSLIPGLGRPPGEGKGNPPPYSGNFLCLLPFEEMTTHSSILAWKIPWTEDPGRLQSMGSQRVIHD